MPDTPFVALMAHLWETLLLLWIIILTLKITNRRRSPLTDPTEPTKAVQETQMADYRRGEAKNAKVRAVKRELCAEIALLKKINAALEEEASALRETIKKLEGGKP